MAPSAQVRLPDDLRRVVIRGSTASGKTTLARAIARAYGLVHIELDALFHQPGWTTLPEEEFVARVRAATDAPRWVACGNYRPVVDLLLERADTVVAFDLPRRVVMRRVVARSLRRGLRGEELWNGNRERLSTLWSTDPSTSIVAWTWSTHARRHDQMRELLIAPPAGARVVHVATVADQRALHRSLADRGSRSSPAVAR